MSSRHPVTETSESENGRPPLMDNSGPAAPSQQIVLHNSPQGWFRQWSVALFALSIPIVTIPIINLGYLFQASPIDPHDYAARTKHVLSTSPLIDGHNDLPHLIRAETYGKLYDGTLDFNGKLLGHTDIERMRKGQMGGQFWSTFVECPDPNVEIDDPTWVVRDTLETIDIARRFIQEYPDTFRFCNNPRCAKEAFKKGLIASFIGIEGGHQVGNSLGTIRQMYDLGARYITTTHNCDNAFATAASTVAAGGEDNGLTEFGHEYVTEMNRLGMMIDLSHVSHQTMRDVLSITRAPIIFSHSGAYTVQKHLRHVPDDVLRNVKQNGGIVMATFVTRFLNMKHPEDANIHDVVDHIMHIVKIAGWEHVGVGSDFSGTPAVPIGLEDVSKYPDLVALLMEQGATDEQIRLFAGENLLRVWANIEKVAQHIQAEGTKPNENVWQERIKGWATGFVNSPFMLKSTRDARKDTATRRAYMFNVDPNTGKHDPAKVEK